MKDNNSIFFIVGRGRSGSSLLQTVLNTHPQIAIAPEAQFVMCLYRKYRNSAFDQQKISEFFEELFLEERLGNWGIDRDQLKEELLSCHGSATFDKLCITVYRHYALRKGKSGNLILGDKNPHYALYIKDLLDIFPEAKFIHLLRDCRDNVLSYQNVTFDLSDTYSLAERWNIYHGNILKFSEKMPDKFLRVKYEDFLRSSDVELDRICNFLNVKYDEAMLTNYMSNAEWDVSWRKNISKPIDSSNLMKWKKEMSEDNVECIEYVSGKLIIKFDYGLFKDPNGFKCAFKTIGGVMYAKIFTFLERVIYLLPLSVIEKILAYYRRKTETIEVSR